MAKYAIAHAFQGASFVAVFPETGDAPPKITRLNDDDAKEAFLFDTLKPGDALYLELGGPGDKVALLAAFQGMSVFRIPTFRLGNKAQVASLIEGRGWPIGDEQADAEDTGDALTARKMRALALVAANDARPADFYESLETDRDILEIRQLYRSYRMLQKVLIANYQRMISVWNDAYLLEVARDPGRGALGRAVFAKGRVNAGIALRAVNALLTDIPEQERKTFLAKLGLEKLKIDKGGLTREAVTSLFRKIIEQMMKGNVMSPFLVQMKALLKQIEKKLETHPVYQGVFRDLPGCGPLIAARMMSSIVDIRRFPSRATLRAFAGYHLFEDGTRACRRAGRVSNWNMELKQGVYLWCQQTLKRKDSPWRSHLDRLRAYELYKLLRARHAQVVRENLRDADGNLYELLPIKFQERTIATRHDVMAEDLAVLAAHVDELRKKAGVKPPKSADAESEANDDNGEEAVTARDRTLAKLVQGVKMSALQKGLRRLGQELLNKHVYPKWRGTLGLENPMEPRRRDTDSDAPFVPPLPAPGMNDTAVDAAE